MALCCCWVPIASFVSVCVYKATRANYDDQAEVFLLGLAAYTVLMIGLFQAMIAFSLWFLLPSAFRLVKFRVWLALIFGAMHALWLAAQLQYTDTW